MRRYTIEEYLALEKKTGQKLEYHDGRVVAMAGGTVPHSVISTNMLVELGIGLKGKPCRALNSDARLALEKIGSYVFADAFVVCGEIETSDIVPHAITNASVIIEVLSDSTIAYDQGEKFYKYRQLDSFKEYMLIRQNMPVVETYVRRDKDLWKIARYEGLDAILDIETLDVSIPLSDIYGGVAFEAEEPLTPLP